jgi:hypothetical protein
VAGGDAVTGTASLPSPAVSPSFLASSIVSGFAICFAIKVAARLDFRDIGPASVVDYLLIALSFSRASLDNGSPF